MNASDKRNYLLRFHRFQKSRETFFAPKIFTAIRTQYDTLLKDLTSGLNEHQAIAKIDPEPVRKVLKDIYIDAATIYGAKVRADLNRLVPRRLQNPNSFNILKSHKISEFGQIKARLPMGFSEEMRRLIEQYFSLDILNESEDITDTTKKLIREVFTNAYAKGEGIDDIVKQLKDTELSAKRSRTIARTETVTSANAGALFVAKSTGLDLNKEWLSASDHRVRHPHRLANGQTIGVDDYFNVGGFEMAIPGDHGGKNGRLIVPPELTINCRCTTLFIPIE